MTAIQESTESLAACSVPLVFTGQDGFTSAELLATSTAEATDAAWADGIVAGLGSGERALVALPFTPGGAAVSHRVRPSCAAPEGAVPGGRLDRFDHRWREVPSPETYAANVSAALERIGRDEVQKVVLGRCLDVVSSPALRAEDVVGRLLDARPGRYVFSLPYGRGEQAPTLLGASPELLVRRIGRDVWSTPLAGSIPRAADPDEDTERAEALQQSAKDLAEHAFVIEDIVRALSAVCSEVHAPSEPELLATDTLWHLATPIRARLLPAASLSALRLAQLLHPTPALGGVPTSAALSVIDELEGERGPFGGAVGWVDADGDGEFAVTIRSGLLDGPRLRLFAGAGIVAGSVPASEVRETATKLSTMARAVGVAGLTGVGR